MGSTTGKIFRISSFGESHGKALGVVVDGCPAGLELAEADIQPFLERRRPNQSPHSSGRNEEDICTIISGVFEGKTTGTPIMITVTNSDAKSSDYNRLKDVYRPAHADYVYDAKYGFRDYRGGGRSSGRETLSRVMAGAIASKLLDELGIKVHAFTQSIAHISARSFDLSLCKKNSLYMPDMEAAVRAEDYIETVMNEGDSLGGIVSCIVEGLPAGIGEPVFGKLDAMLASAIMSIGSVKAVEFGAGFMAANMRGSEYNAKPHHSGGIVGGISEGSKIFLSAAIKPTPSISIPQEVLTVDGSKTTVSISGRHDAVIVPRVVVVVESMVAITLLDSMLLSMSSKLENVKKVYK